MSRAKVRIFDNEAVETLAILYKRHGSADTFAKLAELSTPLIHAILKSEKYPDWEDVNNFLFLQMERWIMRWVPGKGHFYAYMAASIKNAAASYTARASLYRQKVVGTDVPLDEIGGADHDSCEIPYREAFLPKLRDALSEVEVRWAEPEIRSALRYCFVAILNGGCRSTLDRGGIIRYLTQVEVTRQDGSTYFLTKDQSKYLLDYAHGAVRSTFLTLKLEGVFLTPGDLLRLRFQFSRFCDIEQVIGTEAATRLCTHFAGQTIKFPPAKTFGDVTRQASNFNAVMADADGEHPDDVLRDARMADSIMIQGDLGSYPLFDKNDPYLKDIMMGYDDDEEG